VAKQIKIIPLEHMDQVVRHAILVKEGESPYTDKYRELLAEAAAGRDEIEPLPTGMQH
jgi:predicted ATP-dependent protease